MIDNFVARVIHPTFCRRGNCSVIELNPAASRLCDCYESGRRRSDDRRGLAVRIDNPLNRIIVLLCTAAVTARVADGYAKPDFSAIGHDQIRAARGTAVPEELETIADSRSTSVVRITIRRRNKSGYAAIWIIDYGFAGYSTIHLEFGINRPLVGVHPISGSTEIVSETASKIKVANITATI